MGLPPKSVSQTFELFKGVAAHWDACLQQGREPSLEVTRSVFETAALVLRTYVRNYVAGPPQSREPFPVELAYLIANQISYILAGKLPAPIRRLTGGTGRDSHGPHEAHDIGIAVAFIKAAKAGLIADRSPVKTVSRSYGVNDSAVRKWQRKHSNVEVTDFFTTATDADRPVLIAHEMKRSARRYRLNGRGLSGQAADYSQKKS